MSEERALSPVEKFSLQVDHAKDAFRRVGLDEEVFNREAAYAKQIALENNAIMNCQGGSIVKAVANVALTGLTLDPVRKLAFLIPRKNKCILQPSYRGLMKLVTSTGAVLGFEAKVVYKGDLFEFEEGLDAKLVHKSLDLKEELTEEEEQLITFRRRDPYAACRCAYSVAILPGGVRSFVIVPKWRIEKAKAVAQGTDKHSSPWKQWPEEQIRKTVLAYHTKTLDVGEKAAAAVQLFHDNDGIQTITEDVTSGLLGALGLDSDGKKIEHKQADVDNMQAVNEEDCQACEKPLDPRGLCHNPSCPEGVPA